MQQLFELILQLGLLQKSQLDSTPTAIVKAIRNMHQSTIGLQESNSKLSLENIRLKNELRDLKQKQQRLRNGNNTQSSFMLPSQFKDTWQTFLKQDLTSAFCQYIEQPSEYQRKIVQFTRAQFQTYKDKLSAILRSQLKVLGLGIQFENELFSAQLKFLQNRNQNIDWPAITTKLHIEQQELQIIGKSIRKIMPFLLLQQQKYELVSEVIQQFNKKQHICIQGFVKEGEDVIVLLDLKKGTKSMFKKGVIPLKKQIANDSVQQSRNLSCKQQILKKFQLQIAVQNKQQKEQTQTKQSIPQPKQQIQNIKIEGRQQAKGERFAGKPSIFEQFKKQIIQIRKKNDENQPPRVKQEALHDNIISLKQKIQSQLRSKKPLSTLKQEILKQLMKSNNYEHWGSRHKEENRPLGGKSRVRLK